jgi:hypothetical protein
LPFSLILDKGALLVGEKGYDLYNSCNGTRVYKLGKRHIEVRSLSEKEQSYKLVIKDNLKIKREERRKEENPLKTPILMLIRLLIRRGSILKAKLRMAKRLGKARAVISPPLKSIVYP